MSQENKDETTVSEPKATVLPLWLRLLPVLAFLFLFVAMNASGAAAAGFQETPGSGLADLDFAGIMDAFWDSANIVFGMTGLVALIALPYGINFAFQFLTSIFNRFTSAMRF